MIKTSHHRSSWMFLLILFVCEGSWADLSPQMASSLPPGQPVGTLVTWMVNEPGLDPVDYRLSVALQGEPDRVIYDFSDKNIFEWAPIDEGTYTITASVRNLLTQETADVAVNFDILPLATGTDPVITETDHPLVAIYNSPPCSSGNRIRVFFKPVGKLFSTFTSYKPCHTNRSTSFYIAGMLAETTYVLFHQVEDGNNAFVENGPVLFHTTGTLPAEFPFPEFEMTDLPDTNTSISEKVILVSAFHIEDDAIKKLLSYATDILAGLSGLMIALCTVVHFY